MTQRIPAEVFPPGDFLKEELEARGWSQAVFAEIIGRDVATVNRIVSGKAQITPETACLLEEALNLDAEYWLNLESAYQLGKMRSKQNSDRDVGRRARLHDRFPIKSMLARGWIEQSDNIEVLYHRVFSYFKINDLDEEPKLLHAAKKKLDKTRTPNQNAWLFRTFHLAQAAPVSPFTKRKLETGLEKLRSLVEAPEEIRLIPRILAEAGVRFVVVEPLKGSKIDGACYWIDAISPVVALSLLHPSVDCFWFDLIHELMHVVNGHGKDEVVLDEDIQNSPSNDKEEELVNNEAENWLIPTDVFDDFVTRHSPIFSRQNVLGFARRIHVHPGVVAGRLHKKGIIPDWAIHGKQKINVRNTIASTALCDGWGVSPQI